MTKQFYDINEELIERIKAVMKEHNLRASGFAAALDYNQGDLSRTLNGKRPVPESLLRAIVSTFGVDYQWLVRGEGEMRVSKAGKNFSQGREQQIPFFSDIPVSAGQADLMQLPTEEQPTGFISIAGVTGKYAFPVVGCSMEPVIHAGDIIVVDPIERWDKTDPDKIYLIFTHEDRMIKHIETDEANPDILWCVSPNYKRFSLPKADIRCIYKVTFYGRLA